jgi:hypothetical protein
VAGAVDVTAIASLRSLWSAGAEVDADFEGDMAAWLAAEGDRRTTWLQRTVAAVLQAGRVHRSRRGGGR